MCFVITITSVLEKWRYKASVSSDLLVDTSVWLKGILVGVILTISFIIFETQKSKNTVIHATVFAPILGAFIAYGCYYFAL